MASVTYGTRDHLSTASSHMDPCRLPDGHDVNCLTSAAAAAAAAAVATTDIASVVQGLWA
jgi:hypothetical protein